ncbi:putative disease resistance RPP13-like protein 1 [Rosa sericea]
MDVELAGGSLLSSFLSVLLDGIASAQLIDFIRRQEKTPGLLKKLKMNLLAVNEVVDDAEERQIRYSAVREWLDELTDTLGHADDLLDEIRTEALRRKLEDGLSGESSATPWVKKVFSVPGQFEKTMDQKLVGILERSDFILNLIAALALKIRGVIDRPRAILFPTSSLVDESGIYGREKETDTIISLLLSRDATDDRIGVIPIVGMCGLGKTTLAQLVYNDPRVKREFDLQVWVCVTDGFDVVRITQSIYESIFSEACFIINLNLLQSKLGDALAGMKFLIVLDDVWNENYTSWDLLRRPFQFGAQGSKIIVTTRNQGVAFLMGTLPTHHLSQLSEQDCWNLFAKHAFRNAKVGAHSQDEMVKLRSEIVKKCNGLPSVAKSLGGVLGFQSNLKDWEMILKSEIWELPGGDMTLQALWLSYYYLPSHLKRCFAYCSIFPKGYQFTKSELVSLWMAEDLLPPNKSKTMEQVGDDYFHLLISRSFFQHSGPYNQSLFTMHDLISDLAMFLSGEFSVRLEEGDESLTIVRKTRHFSYMKSHVTEEKLEGLYNARYLRTFLSIPQYSRTPDFQMSSEVLCDLLPTLQCLRVLNLSGYDIKELPGSVSSLTHLRQLVLSGSSIQKLPDSICTLYNLQTLLLSYCKELVELPTNLGSLINLRHLDIKGTKLKKMPPFMGKLKNLQLLTDYVLDKHSGDSIAELSELQHLHGSLSISGLDHNVDDVTALKANLRGKKYLNELGLKWEDVTEESQKDTAVLDQLQPHANLRELVIISYGGSTFPGWLGDPYFSNLSSIELVDCKHCSFLPPLERLPSLAKLSIKGFEELLSIGSEFCGPFRSLKELSFINMLKWQEWCYVDGSHEEGGVFPNLCELTLDNCPELTDIVPLDNFPKLEDVKLLGLKSFAGSLSQESHCPKFLSLCRLIIDGCPKFVWSSDGGMDAPNLKEMHICDSREFRSLPKQMHTLLPSLEHLKIKLCPEFKSFPEGGLPPALKSLEFDCYKGLFENRQLWGLQTVSSLRDVRISFQDGEEVFSFPERLLPTSLTCLSISNLPNVTTLEDLSCFNSLQSLFISRLPKLQSLPEEASSLSRLVIWDCPSLQERVQKERREDRSKIADIPCVEINGEEI